MMTTTNEQLAGIRARLLDMRFGLGGLLAVPAVDTAIAEIVPDMTAMTGDWVALMLRDKAYLADCRGDNDIANELLSVAGELDALELRCKGE
jgi:hypothetical protein